MTMTMTQDQGDSGKSFPSNLLSTEASSSMICGKATVAGATADGVIFVTLNTENALRSKRQMTILKHEVQI
jgi:hypothetical protein